ncbi:hypothetical protein ACLB2K_013302 [Fragaria x ananassa]
MTSHGSGVLKHGHEARWPCVGGEALKHEREARWPRVGVESLKHEGEVSWPCVGDFAKKRERESNASVPSLRVCAAARPAPFYSCLLQSTPVLPLLLLLKLCMALRKSLICAKSRGFTKTDVEGDSKLVINVVNDTSDPPWKLFKMVQDIKTLSSLFEFVCFKYVFQTCVPPKASSALAFHIVNIGCTRDTSI